MSEGGVVGGPDEHGDYPDTALADPEAEVDFTPGAVAEFGDPADHGHDLPAEQ